MSFLQSLFDDQGLTPHGFCLSWDPELMGVHVVSDLLIGLSYYSIPIVLAVFAVRRTDLAFRRVFWLFGVFILACGTTHFMAVWTLWHPDYGAEGAVKAITAAASLLTAAQLWPLLPRALALPSPAALRQANEALVVQMRERDAAAAALQRETGERLRAEAMLHQAQKMEAIGQLTGGIAHDFNNLLTIVVANLEMLDHRLARRDPELRKFVERSMRGAQRGAALTQQLLAYARRQPLHPEAVDVARLVEGTVELLHGTLRGGVTLHTRMPPGLWQAEADPHQLETALVNLALNARDAMPEGGRLEVQAANLTLDAAAAAAMGDVAPGDYVALAMADNGTGMPPEVREAAFQPFFTTKGVGQGSGLGLSQVWGFIKQSNGHVMLESTPGRGTRVTLYLRRAPPPPSGEVAGSTAAPAREQ